MCLKRPEFALHCFLCHSKIRQLALGPTRIDRGKFDMGLIQALALNLLRLRELSRCRHAALDRILLLPTETYVGDSGQCSRMDDSPDDPGISNAWDSSDSCGASGGGPSRGA